MALVQWCIFTGEISNDSLTDSGKLRLGNFHLCLNTIPDNLFLLPAYTHELFDPSTLRFFLVAIILVFFRVKEIPPLSNILCWFSVPGPNEEDEIYESNISLTNKVYSIVDGELVLAEQYTDKPLSYDMLTAGTEVSLLYCPPVWQEFCEFILQTGSNSLLLDSTIWLSSSSPFISIFHAQLGLDVSSPIWSSFTYPWTLPIQAANRTVSCHHFIIICV